MQQDQKLEVKIASLRQQIKNWALKHEFWDDSSFYTALEYHDHEPNPRSPCLTVLKMSDALREVMLGPYSSATDKLEQIVEDNDCWMENDGCTLSFLHWDDEVSKEFADYFNWQWMVDLIKPDYTALYHELFRYFNSQPEKLHKLSPRHFEILMSELLQKKGYETVLGPGTNDKGIDIIIFNHNLISPVKTLVQVKRYSSKYAIKLEAVSSLYGTLMDQDPQGEKGYKALFITSSYFLPSAIRFAARHSTILELANKKDIILWNFQAATAMEDNLQKYLSVDYISDLLQHGGEGLAGKLLYTDINDSFKDTVYSDFFMILKDTTNVSLIMKLPKLITERQCSTGFEIPSRDLMQCLKMKTKDCVHRVKKVDSGGEWIFRGQRRTYMLWDGQPRLFILD